jgi:hypothetical protein
MSLHHHLMATTPFPNGKHLLLRGCRSSLTCDASIECAATYLPLLAALVTEAEIYLDAFTLSVYDADNKRLTPPTRMHVRDTLHDIMPTSFSVCRSLYVILVRRVFPVGL